MALDQPVRNTDSSLIRVQVASSKADHPMILPVISSTVPSLITTSRENRPQADANGERKGDMTVACFPASSLDQVSGDLPDGSLYHLASLGGGDASVCSTIWISMSLSNGFRRTRAYRLALDARNVVAGNIDTSETGPTHAGHPR